MILNGFVKPLINFTNDKLIILKENILYLKENNNLIYLDTIINESLDFNYNLIVYITENGIEYKIMDYQHSTFKSSNLQIKGASDICAYKDSLCYVIYDSGYYTAYIYNIETQRTDIIYRSKKKLKIESNNECIFLKEAYYLSKIIIYQDYEIKEIFVGNTYFIGYWPQIGKITYNIFNDTTHLYVRNKTFSLEGILQDFYSQNNKLYITLLRTNQTIDLISLDLQNFNFQLLMNSTIFIEEFIILKDYIYIHFSDSLYMVNNWELIELYDYYKITSKVLSFHPKKFFNLEHHQSIKNKIPYDKYYNNEINTNNIVIYLHGGPHKNITRNIDSIKDILLKSFQQLIIIHYPGSLGFGKNYETSLYGEWGKKDIESILEVLDELTFKDISIIGESYGATLALLLVYKYNINFKKCLAISGPINIEEYYSELTPFHKNIFKRRLLFNKSMLFMYDLKNISPINYFKDSKTITTIVYGEYDLKIGLKSFSNIREDNILNLEVEMVENADHSLKSIFQNLKNKNILFKFLET